MQQRQPVRTTRFSRVKKKTDEAGIPMDVINMMDYGMMKGDKVLATAEAMM